MATHTVRYTSPAKAYRLTSPFSPHTDKVDHWTLSESIHEHPREDLRREGVYEYHVVMEKEVATEQDLSGACSEACTIVKELETVWIYAAARPYNFMRLTIQFIEGPHGWSGNFKEVKQAIRRESQAKIFLEIQHNQRNWETPPFLPLETALKAREAYVTADQILRDLIDLHAGAFMNFGQPRFVLLAKALEIAGAFYRASSRQARNAGLQTLVMDAGLTGKLTRTVEWLFDIANTRREIRHAWDRDASDLHPQPTVQEAEDFVRNADLVVRAFICAQLSLPIVSYHGQL
ncbi:MAG TPA: hypothetical protein VGY66_26075 [Gemmataceae bacterium]|jgi:hypothetical protein|nr:hypothetical protein [Gemmataceae bacterium]